MCKTKFTFRTSVMMYMYLYTDWFYKCYLEKKICCATKQEHVLTHARARTHTHTHTLAHACIGIHIHTYINTHTYVHTHAYTHTHTHSHARTHSHTQTHRPHKHRPQPATHAHTFHVSFSLFTNFINVVSNTIYNP